MQKVLDSRKHTDPTSEPAHDGDVHSLSHPPTETLSVSLLRHYQQGFEQVGKDIPNDAVVEVRLGTSQELFARGHTFTVGALTSKNKVKGTDVPLPPVHFLERKDYIDLCMALGDDLMQAIQTGAHFDESIGVVEVPVKIPEVTDTFPSTVTMSGREYKQLLASLEHEFRHAAGEGELLAYYHGDRAAVALGLKETARTPFEIMLMLEETDFYDASSLRDSLNELDDHFPEDAQRYYQWRESHDEDEDLPDELFDDEFD